MAQDAAAGGERKGVYGDFTLKDIIADLRKNVTPSKQSWYAWSYEDVVNATALIDHMVKQSYCNDRPMALEIGKDLQKQGAIKHVWDSNPEFRDQAMFFRFGDSEVTDQLSDAYDVVVIGAGTAGLSASSLCAGFGVKCALLEGNRIGGDCTWTGCVPSKSLIKASHVMHAAKKAAECFAPDHPVPTTDMKKVKEYVHSKIHHIAQHDLHLMEESNVPLRYCKASFIDKNTLAIKDKDGKEGTITAKSFILCLGAVAAPPPLSGLKDVPFHTYETIFDVDVLPKRMCVVGGGVIGCELAQSFARFGTKVTLIANQLLPKEPKKVHDILAAQFVDDGIELVPGRGSSVSKVDAEGKVLKLMVKQKNSAEEVAVETDLLLIATGRRPNTDQMNLDKAGVELTDNKLIKVTDALQTTAPHIYAAGDCCTLQQFTHYASQMGVWAARNLLFPGTDTPTHWVPRATFTEPEVASVGCTETEARAAGYEVFSQPGSQNERAVCEGDTESFIDVYLDQNQMIKGACIMNQRAGELLSEILVCIAHKLPFTKLGLRDTLHAYPTYSWSTMILATEVDSKKFRESTSGKLVQWYVGR